MENKQDGYLVWYICKRGSDIAVESQLNSKIEAVEKMPYFVRWLDPKDQIPSDELIAALKVEFGSN